MSIHVLCINTRLLESFALFDMERSNSSLNSRLAGHSPLHDSWFQFSILLHWDFIYGMENIITLDGNYCQFHTVDLFNKGRIGGRGIHWYLCNDIYLALMLL